MAIELARGRGCDFNIGRRLFQLVREAGFAEPEIAQHQPVYVRGEEKAFEWMKFLTNQESGKQLGIIGGTIGGRPDVYGDADLLKIPYRQVFKGLMDNAMPSRITANWRQTEAEQALTQLTQPLWTGDAKPDQAFLDDVTAQIQTIMDKPKA